MNILNCLLLFMYFLDSVSSKLKGHGGELRIYRFEEDCEGVDPNKTALRYLENKIVLVNNSYQVYFALNDLKDIDSDIKFQLNLKRCKERGGQCEPYQNLNLQKACKFINMSAKPWSPLFQALEPPISCPIKKGIYKMKQTATVDISPRIAKIPMWGNYLWKTEVRVLRQDNDEVLQCLQNDAQILSN